MLRRLLFTMLFCAAAEAQSLEEAMVLAYDDNPRLLAARVELREVDETSAQVRSLSRPRLSASGDVSYAFSNDGDGWDSRTPGSFSVELRQPLFSAGLDAATSRARDTVMARRAGLTATEQRILLEVVSAYMDAVLARRVLALAANNEERLQRQLDATENRFRVGAVSRTDVSQARAGLAGAQASREQAAGTLIVADAVFEELIGVEPGELAAPAPVDELPADIQAALDLADANNPTILAALHAEAVARSGIEVERADLLPSAALRASLGRSYPDDGRSSGRTSADVAVTLTVPLYQGGLEASQLRQARETAARLRLEVEQARRGVRAALIDAWQQRLTTRARIAALEERVTANEVALEGTERELRLGGRTVLDVLDAEQDLFRSQVDLAQAQSDEVVASYRLKSVLGLLTASGLGLPVSPYDVESHYDEVRGNTGLDALFGAD